MLLLLDFLMQVVLNIGFVKGVLELIVKELLLNHFLGSAEFIELYGEDVSHANYVNNLYKNVLGREADTAGLNYWVGNLTNGIEERHEALLGFSESAENKRSFL